MSTNRKAVFGLIFLQWYDKKKYFLTWLFFILENICIWCLKVPQLLPIYYRGSFFQKATGVINYSIECYLPKERLSKVVSIPIHNVVEALWCRIWTFIIHISESKFWLTDNYSRCLHSITCTSFCSFIRFIRSLHDTICGSYKTPKYIKSVKKIEMRLQKGMGSLSKARPYYLFLSTKVENGNFC